MTDFAITLPSSLQDQGISLRPRTEADTAFLRGLYLSIRWEEVAPLTDWTDAMKTSFLESQFVAQTTHYAKYYSDSQFLIIQCGDEPIGRLYLDHGHPEEIRIVDIAFLPRWCGRGLGGAFLDTIFAEASAQTRAVSIHVESNNPAQRLYFRKGFQRVDSPSSDDEPQVYWLLKWTPAAAA